MVEYEPDPDLVAHLAKQQPRVRQESEAYKRAVIRMTLQHVHKRETALSALAEFDGLHLIDSDIADAIDVAAGADNQEESK